ncbi:MAG: hypothetical protein H7199_06555 [Burkholderiales bacterium]|nr:hypothetical protein [Flavobacterium sp.]
MKNTHAFLTLLLLLTSAAPILAQVGIGNTDPKGALDITSITDGMLIPRLALVATTTATVITPTESELVYNTATVNDVTPGYYYWDNSKWVRLAAGANSDWALTGNAVANNTSFMGTTDDNDVIFKRFSTRAGKLGITETSLGLNALNPLSSGTNNTAIGKSALAVNTSGASNVAVGASALAANTTAANNTAVGNNALAANTVAGNTAIGFSALAANTSGGSNVAVGFNALTTNGTSANNTAVGYNALTLNTAANNTGIGYRALASNIAANNTAIGYSAMAANTGGSFNTAVGYNALYTNTTGQWNTALGYNALAQNGNGQNNVAVGFNALGRLAATPQNSVAIGSSALSNNTATNCTAVGFQALAGLNTGIDNVAVGINALQTNTGGQQNTAVGGEALALNTISSFNTALGYNALRNLTGAQNTAVGYQAGFASATGTGSDNVFVGNKAGYATTNGANNVSIGSLAGDNTTTGTSNVFIGMNAGNNNSSGSFNVAIGVNAGNAHNGTSNNINIGYQTGFVNTTANNVNIGHQAGFSNTTTGNVNLGFQAGFGETTANKLYISNSNADAINALIYGDFTTGAKILRTNSTFQIGNPAGTGYVFPVARGINTQYLASDASGVLSWATPYGTNTLSALRTNLSANQALVGGGWQKINFNTIIFDTNTEFAASRFTAVKAGIYQINAGYHTNSASSTDYYSIAVYVNGVLYQQNSANHFGNGPVSRNINCSVNLAIGGYVEIYAENYETIIPMNIDSFSGKTFFEVQQIR